jgi:hypothetical protein
MRQGFVCNRFPFLKIAIPFRKGEQIAFVEGLYETDDPELVALIEKNDLYGVHIHPRDHVRPEAVAEEAGSARVSAAARHGTRGTR